MASLRRPREQLQKYKAQRYATIYMLLLKDNFIDNRKLYNSFRSVHLFPRAVRNEVPPPTVRKYQHLSQFSHWQRDFSLYLTYMS